jgi:quercetin dioxygenase-like cupin family protein
MTEQKPRYGVDAYLDWVEAEGLRVFEDYAVDLFAVETAMWPRYGVKAAAAHLKGRGDFANMFVFDIPPAGATTPQRHLYEDVVYVLEGTGSTQIEFAGGLKKSFEWGPRSLFAIPLNARHRHFNGSGRDRALIVSTTDLPLVMNTFHDARFVFETDY